MVVVVLGGLGLFRGSCRVLQAPSPPPPPRPITLVPALLPAPPPPTPPVRSACPTCSSRTRTRPATSSSWALPYTWRSGTRAVGSWAVWAEDGETHCPPQGGGAQSTMRALHAFARGSTLHHQAVLHVVQRADLPTTLPAAGLTRPGPALRPPARCRTRGAHHAAPHAGIPLLLGRIYPAA